jgi:hypothetical protein
VQKIFEILVRADGVHDSFVLATVPLTYMRWAVRQIPALHHYVDPCGRYATVKFYTAIMITLCPEVLPHSPSILGSMFTLVSLNAVRGERVLVISGGGRVFRPGRLMQRQNVRVIPRLYTGCIMPWMSWGVVLPIE